MSSLRTILVTGASKGIGASICQSLLSKGHRVIGVSRTNPTFQASSERFVHVQGDVCDAGTMDKAKREVDGGLHGLILNAGSTWPITKISEMSLEDYRRGIEVSLVSPVLWIQALLPELRSGQAKILYTSSSAVKTSLPSWGLFTSPRAGMHQILASLAKEEPSLTCLAIDPGTVDTVAFHSALQSVRKSMPPAYVKWFENVQAGKDFLKPEEPAEAFVKLVLGAPKAKSGSFVTWNDNWINEISL